MIANDLMLKTEFGIKHFAAPVVYDASEFIERNMHRLPSELLHIISKASNEIISQYFKSVLQEAVDRRAEPKAAPGRRRSPKKAVLERFRLDLQGLMESMKGTEARYIRCVKPNETLSPGKMNHCTVMRQLECAGFVTAIDLSRETYPNKVTLEMFSHRFSCLLSVTDRTLLKEMWPYDKVQYMLSKLYAPYLEVYRNCEFTMPYACGKTKVYFRSGALEVLESLRFEYFSARATSIQAGMRRWLAMSLVKRAWKGLIALESLIRGFIVRKQYRSFRSCIIYFQSTRRGKKDRLRFVKQRMVSTFVQSRWRFIHAIKRRQVESSASSIVVAFLLKALHRKKFLRQRWYCTRLQATFRARFIRRRFEYVILICIRLQCFGRSIVASNALRARKSAGKTICEFLRSSLRLIRKVRAAVCIQAVVRRNQYTNLRGIHENAALVIQSYLMASMQRTKFIGMYMTIIKIQSILRMVFVRRRFVITRLSAVKVQSFNRMTMARMRFITAYLAILKIQELDRKSVV